MILFVSIAILCLLLLLMSDIIKLLHIKDLIRKTNARNSATLQKELNKVQAEMKAVKEREFKDSYTYHIQLLRAEEAVKTVQKKILHEKRLADLKSSSAEVIVTYCVKGLISFILFVISIRNRYTPVMIFDESLNFQPLTGMFSFPTGVPNSLSVPMWVLSCNVTFNYINNIIRSKM